MNAADSSSVLDGESHVAFLAPTSAPGVLHYPVLLAVLLAIPDNQGRMVDICPAVRGVKDAAGVLLEVGTHCLDKDSDWLLCGSGLHLTDVIGSHSLVAFDVGG